MKAMSAVANKVPGSDLCMKFFFSDILRKKLLSIFKKLIMRRIPEAFLVDVKERQPQSETRILRSETQFRRGVLVQPCKYFQRYRRTRTPKTARFPSCSLLFLLPFFFLPVSLHLNADEFRDYRMLQI